MDTACLTTLGIFLKVDISDQSQHTFSYSSPLLESPHLLSAIACLCPRRLTCLGGRPHLGFLAPVTSELVRSVGGISSLEGRRGRRLGCLLPLPPALPCPALPQRWRSVFSEGRSSCLAPPTHSLPLFLQAGVTRTPHARQPQGACFTCSGCFA